MTTLLNVQINAVEELYVAIQGYSSSIFPIRNFPEYSDILEGYYDIESDVIKAYDDFMENPTFEGFSNFDKHERRLRFFVDDVLNPKLKSQ